MFLITGNEIKIFQEFDPLATLLEEHMSESGYSLPDVSKRSEMKPAVQEWKS